MLANGERIGDGSAPEVDIAVDPLEGTTLTAKGMPSALGVIALSPRGTMFDPGPCVYMMKLAGGAGDRRPARPRPVARARRSGSSPSARGAASATSWSSCSTASATRTASPGDPQRPARACASSPTATSAPRCSRSPTDRRSTSSGASAARRRASSPRRRSSASAAGSSAGCGRATTPSARLPSTPATTSTSSSPRTTSSRGDDCFFAATGVTDGDVLQGVRYQGARSATTESLVTRSRTGTIRRIRATHDREKLHGLAASATLSGLLRAGRDAAVGADVGARVRGLLDGRGAGELPDG